MKTSSSNRFFAFATTVLLFTGCATASDGSRPVPNIAGTWIGHLSVTSGILEEGGATSGQMRAAFEQQGRRVTGTVVAPGLHAHVDGVLYGNNLSGMGAGDTPLGSGSASFEAQIIGDQIQGTIDDNPFVLRRTK